ncbi:MAG: hypothetical protein M0P74_00785 [Syntrophales bacterium]|jgi:hypothetical protein|nr:hypothetical protein [Syntrophales bacterium]
MSNFNPSMASTILEPVRLTPPVLDDAAAEPILDESGNPVRDEEGNVIHGT